jgi:hypothetical protein
MRERKPSPNRERAVGKVIDGEAIIIDLVSGAYFSITGIGAVVWQAIEEGRTVGDIWSRIAEGHDVDAVTARRDVEQLVDTLLERGLIVVDEVEAPVPEPGPIAAVGRVPYEASALHVYTDMLEMLALDPPMPVIGALPTDWPKDSAS